jgi:two-component system chemotaxis response regulator CheY
MIVDDMPFMRSLLASILAMGGYDVVAEAAGGVEAVQLYREHRPHIILLDLDMPGMGSIETMRQIRTLDAGARIVLCGRSDGEGVHERSDAPPDHGVITKPYVAEEVLGMMERVCGDGSFPLEEE